MTTQRTLSTLALFALLAGCGSSTQEVDARSANDAATGSGARGGNASTSGGADLATAGRGCGTDPVYFAFDSAELDGRARGTVERNAECVRRQQAAAHIVGMTDPRGTEEYNLALGDRRAQSVANHMSRLGVTDVATRSVGEEMSAGDEETSWALDRRAEISLRR